MTLRIITQDYVGDGVEWTAGGIWRLEDEDMLQYVMGPRPTGRYSNSNTLYMSQVEEHTTELTAELLRGFLGGTVDQRTSGPLLVIAASETAGDVAAGQIRGLTPNRIGFSPNAGNIEFLTDPYEEFLTDPYERVNMAWNPDDASTLAEDQIPALLQWMQGDGDGQPASGDVWVVDTTFDSAAVVWPAGSWWQHDPTVEHPTAIWLAHVGGPEPEDNGFSWSRDGQGGRRGLYCYPEALHAHAHRVTDDQPVTSNEPAEGQTVERRGQNAIVVTTPAQTGEPTVEVREEDGFRITITRTPLQTEASEQMYVREAPLRELVDKALADNGIGHQSETLWDESFSYSAASDDPSRWSDVRTYQYDGETYVHVGDTRGFMRTARTHFNWCGVADRVQRMIDNGLAHWQGRVEVSIVAVMYFEPGYAETAYSSEQAETTATRAVDRILRGEASRSDYNQLSLYVDSATARQ